MKATLQLTDANIELRLALSPHGPLITRSYFEPLEHQDLEDCKCGMGATLSMADPSSANLVSRETIHRRHLFHGPGFTFFGL